MEQALIDAHRDKHVRILKIGVLILSVLTLYPLLFSYAGTVHAADTISHTPQAAASCSGSAQLNSKALLVVLLDRSGSLVAGATTDPEGYSGSVTNALADLWPGNIAVIPFGNDQANQLGKGVFAHSSTSDLKTLKNLVDGTFPPPNDADTPLGLAMEHAKTLFEQKGATPCSQVVLITDGQPTGPQGRVDDVRNQFVPWFKSQGIPVNAFGLKLDTNTEDGHNADVLLRDITNTTNGKYTPAVNATDLASSVIGLYSAWKGLSFTPITLNQQNGNYAIPIDDNVTQATVITFHSTNVSVGQLQRTDGATIQLFQTTDRHYQMDNLISPIPSGTYTITVGSDPDASVYALIDSPIKAEFTDSATSAYTGQTFTIKAHFINQQNGGGVVITGATKVTATVTEVVNGQSVKTNVVLNRLSPNSDIFTADYAVHPTTIKLLDQPQKVGTLTLDLTATEGNLTRSATKTVPLYVPQKPPPPPCHEGFWPCFQKQNQTAIAISIAVATPLLLILIVTLILWLIWRQQPAPFGILHTPSVPQKLGFGNYEEDTSDIAVTLAKVGAARSLQKRIFQRSVLTSYEIEHHRDAKGGFDFDPASFQLVFKRGKKMDIHLISGGPIVLRNGNEKFELESGETHDLESGSSIIITNTERATFS